MARYTDDLRGAGELRRAQAAHDAQQPDDGENPLTDPLAEAAARVRRMQDAAVGSNYERLLDIGREAIADIQQAMDEAQLRWSAA